MAEIVQGNIGPEATYDVNFTGGALNVTVKYQGESGGASFTTSINAALMLQKLEAKVTNPMEKAALDMVLGLINKV